MSIEKQRELIATQGSPSLDGSPCSAAIYDETPICEVVNFLNRKCVDAAKLGDYNIAQEIAGISMQVEEALRRFKQNATAQTPPDSGTNDHE